MAKTLIYASGSPTSVKIGDTDTSLYLQVAKDNINVDLTSVKSITVKIADANKNYLKDISISSSSLPDGDKGILVLPLNSDNIGGLNSGDYYFEVWIVTTDNETEIYPDMNVTKFHVFNNIVGGTTVLTTLTMQAFLDRITANQTASETSLANSNAALTAANAANSDATRALNDLNAGNYAKKYDTNDWQDIQTFEKQIVASNGVQGNLTGNSDTATLIKDSNNSFSANDIENLVLNVAALQKVYETEITASNGQVIQFKRIGNVVIANLYGTSTTAVAAWGVLGTIPNGFTNGYYEVNSVIENLSAASTILITYQTSSKSIIVRDNAIVNTGAYLGEAVWFTKDSAPTS